MVISYKNIARVFISLTIIISFLFIRRSLIVLYPIIALVLFYVLGMKITAKQVLIILAFVVLGFISSWMEGLFLSNFILSEYLILPLFIFLISKVNVRPGLVNAELFKWFIKGAIFLLVVVNISAFIGSIFFPDTSIHTYEDTFTGLYGTAGFGSHSLSIMNLGFSAYFLYRKEYFKFVFFVLCGVLGYYGLGLMVFIAALLVMYSTKLLQNWKTILVLLIAGLAMLWFINKFNPNNLNYIRVNIERTMLVLDDYDYEVELQRSKEYKVSMIPRFIIFLDGAQKRLFSDSKVATLGTSPGGYNSRTAFYMNGDFAQNKFVLDHFNNQTIYHEEDIYPLLNRELIKRPYNDGTRNQTFSSIVSVILEYGIFLGVLFWAMFFRKIRSIASQVDQKPQREFIRFLSVFLMMILFVQNYLEYPEIIFPFILLIKLAEVDHINKSKLQTA